MAKRSITLSLPEELVRVARILAARRDTSVSALVADLLRKAVVSDVAYEDAWAAEEKIMAEGIGLMVGRNTCPRDDLHDR